MKISEIAFVPINPNNGHWGFVKFVLNDALVLNQIAIHTLKDGSGIRLNYPTIRGLNCVYPIKKELGNFITYEIQKAWFEFQRAP